MSDQLRKKAKALLERGVFIHKDFPEKELGELVEELRFHQAELQLQNDEEPFCLP